MKVKLKSLKGEVTTLEAEPTARIGDLKAQLAKTMPGSAFRIVHKGKHLDDAVVLGEAYAEDQVMILMVVPRKEERREERREQVKEEVKEQRSPEEERLALLEGSIKQISEMGFSRQEVVLALRMAKYEPNRAIELLINGMVNLDYEEEASLEDEGEEDLNRLLSSDAVKDLKDLLRQDPDADIGPRLAEIAIQQPEFKELIEGYEQEQLRNLLLELIEYEDSKVVLSEEEREAINRLQLLGFTAQNALTAFLACERNESLAASYLFDQRDKGEEIEEEEDDLY